MQEEDTSFYWLLNAAKGRVRRYMVIGARFRIRLIGTIYNFSFLGGREGRDLLFVAVWTPSGPSDDISIRHMGQGKYVVEYSVKEHGTCEVHVKYGNENAPGSPFLVEV